LKVCVPKISKLLIPFPEKEMYLTSPTLGSGKFSCVAIGFKVMPIEDVNVGSVKAVSLSNEPMEGIAKEVFVPKVLLSSKLKVDSILETTAKLLTTAKDVLVEIPDTEITPDDKVILLLSAKVAVSKDSSDGIEVAPIL
jgi:hypothetical protein